MSFSDDFNGGSPGSPLTGPYSAVSDAVYTSAGRGGTVGLQDGGAADGATAFFAYSEADTDTLVLSIDYYVEHGTIPTGATGSAQVLYLYGNGPSGPGSDMLAFSVSTDSSGSEQHLDDFIGGVFGVYPIEGTSTYTLSYSGGGRTMPPYGVWRTAKATLSANVLTFEILDDTGGLVWSYGPIDTAGWLASGTYIGMGYSSDGQRINVDNFSYQTTVPLAPYPHAGWSVGATTTRRSQR